MIQNRAAGFFFPSQIPGLPNLGDNLVISKKLGIHAAGGFEQMFHRLGILTYPDDIGILLRFQSFQIAQNLQRTSLPAVQPMSDCSVPATNAQN